jgi:hypothetical protein
MEFIKPIQDLDCFFFGEAFPGYFFGQPIVGKVIDLLQLLHGSINQTPIDPTIGLRP